LIKRAQLRVPELQPALLKRGNSASSKFTHTHTQQISTQREREIMAEDEEWRKMADTHKMKPEDVKAAGVEGSKRPPGHNPGGVLHQRGLNTVKK
jgi:hypothetical protein